MAIPRITRAKIKKMYFQQDLTISEISSLLDISRPTVYHVLNNEDSDKVADRFEYFAQGGTSGNYLNGIPLPTKEDVLAGDPLTLLCALETIEERMCGTCWLEHDSISCTGLCTLEDTDG